MNTIFQSRYTAFADERMVARGSYADIAPAWAAGDVGGPVLVFDDATGAPVDTPPRPEHAALLARMGSEASSAPATAGADEAPRPSPGRPRLGVVAREVTLLPRHWEWLSTQPGGASAALRRLVEQARKSSEQVGDRRQAGERSYKFMSAIAGHRPEFEEAARALFAADVRAFAAGIAPWPQDVRAHLERLAQGAFGSPAGEQAEP